MYTTYIQVGRIRMNDEFTCKESKPAGAAIQKWCSSKPSLPAILKMYHIFETAHGISSMKCQVSDEAICCILISLLAIFGI